MTILGNTLILVHALRRDQEKPENCNSSNTRGNEQTLKRTAVRMHEGFCRWEGKHTHTHTHNASQETANLAGFHVSVQANDLIQLLQYETLNKTKENIKKSSTTEAHQQVSNKKRPTAFEVHSVSKQH